jgi:hypothetical protein
MPGELAEHTVIVLFLKENSRGKGPAVIKIYILKIKV